MYVLLSVDPVVLIVVNIVSNIHLAWFTTNTLCRNGRPC